MFVTYLQSNGRVAGEGGLWSQAHDRSAWCHLGARRLHSHWLQFKTLPVRHLCCTISHTLTLSKATSTFSSHSISALCAPFSVLFCNNIEKAKKYNAIESQMSFTITKINGYKIFCVATINRNRFEAFLLLLPFMNSM